MRNGLTLQDKILEDLRLDSAFDDVTARLLGAQGEARAKGTVLTRQNGVFSGLTIFDAFASLFEGRLSMRLLVAEGADLKANDRLIEMAGPAGLCLSVERTLINYLAHACGVASLTREFVEAVKPFPVKVLATRKTLPGLREIQLDAVRAGGGFVHRRSLSDGILIKDNHQAIAGTENLLAAAKAQRSPLHGIEIEVQDFKQLEKALEHSPDIVMLDNFTPAEAATAMATIGPRCCVEISGGISLSTIRHYAELQPDYISVGQLTHSAPSMNLTLDLETGS